MLLGRYIVDLYAAEVRLVVEVDGGYHAERATADARRDPALGRAGYRVVRVKADLVTRDLAGAVERVRGAVEIANADSVAPAEQGGQLTALGHECAR